MQPGCPVKTYLKPFTGQQWFVFAVTHFIYEKFVITWIPSWIPFPVFRSWLVPIAFLSAFASLIIQKYVRLSSLLLALMFLIWVLIVNLPRALTLKLEPEWTGTFIALAMSGTGLLIADAVNYKGKTRPKPVKNITYKLFPYLITQ